MEIRKEDLVGILKSIGIAVNEGVSSVTNSNTYPRLVYWEFSWDYVKASGGVYKDVDTYQVSFFSRVPRDPKLLELRKVLKENKLFPQIQHEYVEEKKMHHSYFSIEVLNDGE